MNTLLGDDPIEDEVFADLYPAESHEMDYGFSKNKRMLTHNFDPRFLNWPEYTF
jgi:hypothetical protein